jgi:hypothetical protein
MMQACWVRNHDGLAFDLNQLSLFPDGAKDDFLMIRIRDTIQWAACFGAVSVGSFARADNLSTDQQLEFFESRIRPVLVEHCYKCHNSIDSAKAKLALDHRDGLLKGGKRGPVLVPGHPEKSLLLQVLRHEIRAAKMPKDGPKLDSAVIADFARWIEINAPDPRDVPPTADQLREATAWETTLERRKQWWSFQPLTKPNVPALTQPSKSNHPVDQFVIDLLHGSGLPQAAKADKQTLIRRLSFVLNGLPPTPEETKRFVNDSASNAYETLVDRLLSSPRFGERWARHWMDWIRYAESHGSEGDPAIPHAYRYRDYLIRALNADVPYGVLIKEHVAGDLLEEPRINESLGINESALATAHWRMVFHGFAPTDALDEKIRFTDDQINAFSKAFLGLTVSCARCHDHKFDAISQADYYAMFGILGSTRPTIIDLNTPERQGQNRAQLKEIKRQIRPAVAQVWMETTKTIPTKLLQPPENWKKAIDAADHPDKVLHAWRVMQEQSEQPQPFHENWQQQFENWKKNLDMSQKFGDRHDAWDWNLAEQSDYDEWFRQGNGLDAQPSPSGEFALDTQGNRLIFGIYPAGVYSHGLSTKHRAVLASPRFPLDDEYELWLHIAGEGGAMSRYAVQNYPRSGTVYPITELQSRQWKWQKYDLAYWIGEDIHIELCTAGDAPVVAKSNDRSWFGIRQARLIKPGTPAPKTQTGEFFHPLVDAARKNPTSLQDLADVYADAIARSIQAWGNAKMTDGQALLLDALLQEDLLPNQIDQFPSAKDLIEEYRRLESAIPMPTRVAALAEADSFDQPLFVRGDHKKLGEPVQRRFLEAIDPHSYETSGSGRFELADDLVRPDNPLTARVIVNRIWHHLFGRGIVSTPDNFGQLGDKPTHPELLDFLAVRFIENGWSIKDTMRFLVMSNTWQVDTQPTEQHRRIDPDNRLLGHAHVRRLEAEAIRDALLSASGDLDTTMHGPSVDGASRRRSVYVRIQRNSLDPFLRVFDFPEPFSTTGRRDVTNVPAQSLTLMNDPRVQDCASHWATRIINDENLPSDEQRIDHMFQTAFARPASSEEITDLKKYITGLRGDHEKLIQQKQEFQIRIDHHRAAIQGLTEPVRNRLIAQKKEAGNPVPTPQPIAQWDFDDDLRDAVGAAHGEGHGSARIEGGALILDGRSAYVVTAPLDITLKEKTLEAWVRLDTLTQRGGGVLTVQTPNGQLFDSIVFGEKDPEQWLAGSNNFARTQTFEGPKETEAQFRPIHVAITYHLDGRITGYRDGKPYGKPYGSNGPLEFEAGNTTVAFGVRHLPAGGNRMLAGSILQARLYDRALTPDEVHVTSGLDPHFVSEAEILAVLTDQHRREIQDSKGEIAKLDAEIRALGPVSESIDDQAVWTDLARAIFSFKEFIYLR